MVKVTRSLKKLESDTNAAKTGNSAFFRGKRQIPQHGMKIHMQQNTAGSDNDLQTQSN